MISKLTILMLGALLVSTVPASAQDWSNVFSPSPAIPAPQAPGQFQGQPDLSRPAVTPPAKVFAPSAAPLPMPVLEDEPDIVLPPAILPEDIKLEIPPAVAPMLKAYDAAIKRLTPEQRSYIENIVQEGHKIDEPLHDALVKSLDWGMCSDMKLVDARAAIDYDRYRKREEAVYLENMSAFEEGVLSGVNYIDARIVRDKITAQGVTSMAAIKQLYQLDLAKAGPAKIKYDCETLVKFLDDYNARNIF